MGVARSRVESQTDLEDTSMRAASAATIRMSQQSRWSVKMPSLSWRPTSAQKLELAEKKMLTAIATSEHTKVEQWMTKAGEHEINTVKIGSGPPLVLLHGFGAGLGFWGCNLAELAEHNTVYAIDLPGFGRSSRAVPQAGLRTAEQAEAYFVETIDAWCAANQLDRFALLGHSFGGYLSALYAIKHPNKIAKLIMADPWGVPPPPPPEQLQKYPLRYRRIGRVLSSVNPLSTIRVAGAWGQSLI
eukprot:TRINITY_DN6217_c0_g2_i1.p1 TRINITY_DN6217_c0_g2~~TRINITY_DN6217_c0_g2_i1.p1  ORF type:complete len:244 (-),score=67.81 TRINITY_DN6217_c0_g2_i1:6-737(-)